MKILQERISEHAVISCCPHNRRDLIETCKFACPQSPLPHDELIRRGEVITLPDNDGLKNADFFDGIRQFLQLFFGEYGPRLLLIGRNIINGDFSEISPLNRDKIWLFAFTRFSILRGFYRLRILFVFHDSDILRLLYGSRILVTRFILFFRRLLLRRRLIWNCFT